MWWTSCGDWKRFTIQNGTCLQIVRFKFDPLAAFSFRAQRGSDSKIAWNRGVGAQQKCCAPTSLNCLMPVTNLPTVREKAEIFLSWMAFVSYLSVPQNVYPEQFNPPTSQCIFTSPYITMHRFATQSLIGNSGRTCTLSGCTCDCSADVFKSRNRGLNARKQWRTLHKN